METHHRPVDLPCRHGLIRLNMAQLPQGFLEDDPELANAVDVSEFGTGYRPLHYAAYGGFLDVCEALHAAGARALSAGDNGVTALFLAAQAGKADVVRFLLDLVRTPRPSIVGLCLLAAGETVCFLPSSCLSSIFHLHDPCSIVPSPATASRRAPRDALAPLVEAPFGPPFTPFL